MIGISEIEKALAKQLTPLRLALEQNNVLVSALPKYSDAYSSEAREGIEIIVSKASGVAIGGGDIFRGFQDINYTITIHVCLGLRYQDSPEEKNVLDWVCEQIFKLLYNFELPNAKDGLSFIDYTPLRPENGQWMAQLQFSFAKQLRAYTSIDEGSLGTQFVQLFGQGAIASDTTLISQVPR